MKQRSLMFIVLALLAGAGAGSSPPADVAGAPPSGPAAPAPAAQPADSGPRLQLGGDVKDFGVVPHGDVVEHDFAFSNGGNQPLEILEISSQCPCLTATYDSPVAPGASGKVHIRLDTNTLNGRFDANLFLRSNDPTTSLIQLKVLAMVQPHIAMKPGYVRFLYVQQEQEGTIVQTLWPQDGRDFSVLAVESPYPFITTSFREATPEERQPDAEGRQWHVETTIHPDAEVGALRGFVTIRTDHPKDPLLRLPLSGFVRPVLAVTPAQGDFGEVKVDAPLRTTFTIANFATELIPLTRVETDLPRAEVKLLPITEGRRYQVQLVLHPEMPKGAFKSTMRIFTASPKRPVLEVPLSGVAL